MPPDCPQLISVSADCGLGVCRCFSAGENLGNGRGGVAACRFTTLMLVCLINGEVRFELFYEVVIVCIRPYV